MVIFLSTGRLDDKYMEDLNKITAEIFEAKYEEGLKWASEHSYEARIMCDDWWHGECVYTEEYKSNIPKDSFEHGHSIIATVTSQGFG